MCRRRHRSVGGLSQSALFQKISTTGVLSSMLEIHHISTRTCPTMLRTRPSVATEPGILFDATSADRNAAGPKAPACQLSLSSFRSPSPPGWTNCRPPLLILVSIATPNQDGLQAYVRDADLFRDHVGAGMLQRSRCERPDELRSHARRPAQQDKSFSRPEAVRRPIKATVGTGQKKPR
jgi:hypothetical protein